MENQVKEIKETYAENLSFSKSEKLIEEDYTYDNLVNNPILKPISEADKTMMDLMEMAYKKFLDAKINKDIINKTITDIPAYQTSAMVAKLLKFNSEVEDIIKLQNLQIKNLRECIKSIYQIVLNKYGVYKEEEKIERKKINYEIYLNDLLKKDEIKEFATLILKEFKKDKNTNEKRKFENACGDVFTKESDKNKKTIIAKIMRMEY